jgi:hypothetical protein
MRRLATLDDVREYLEGEGEHLEASQLGLALPASLGERWPPGRIEIVWESRPGVVVLYLALPFDVPEERRAAAGLAFLEVNAKLLVGSFILTPLPAFALGIFLDEDGAVAAKVLDRAIHACREAGQRHVDAVAGAVLPRATPAPALPAGRVSLSPEERARLTLAIERDWPPFAARAGGPLLVTERGQRWFRLHRVLEVGSPTPAPAMSIHVALTPHGQVLVLRGHLEHFVQMANEEPPAGLDAEENALAYATDCDAWTTEAELGELVIASLDEVPWRGEMTAKEQQQARELRLRLAGALHPPQVARGDRGFTVKTWLISERRLIYRELHIPPSGQVLRDERVWAENLGVPRASPPNVSRARP